LIRSIIAVRLLRSCHARKPIMPVNRPRNGKAILVINQIASLGVVENIQLTPILAASAIKKLPAERKLDALLFT
jgi:hypothetical protein